MISSCRISLKFILIISLAAIILSGYSQKLSAWDTSERRLSEKEYPSFKAKNSKILKGFWRRNKFREKVNAKIHVQHELHPKTTQGEQVDGQIQAQKLRKTVLSCLYLAVAMTCDLVVWDGLHRSRLSSWHASSFWFLSTVAVALVLQMIFSDPGVLSPQHPYPPSERWCDKCHLYKPHRAHHCRRCGRCVLRMDHHCPYLGNCVGRSNLAAYLLMLVLGAVVGTYGCCLAFGQAQGARPRSQAWEVSVVSQYYGPWIMILLLFPLGAFATVLLGIQVFGLWMDSTTIERWLASGDKEYVQNVAILER
eukprot:CAMPEP_0117758200 /NCGR_PEP_ID=MMETSP0947-20121206/15227_1 /TAXON_ID=44440 /ORGANISM="Chattonella subsalsa, Strain CCMP2191" /LENGTH=307 /DNA_ID=CAMNT_0005578323 /DNA_START=122 /DNA_END=1045 /DNA_ORIENTATION=-